MQQAGIGDAVRSKEDERLISGRGSYADDLPIEGAARAVFVRSPHAHARIQSIDIEAARTHPGVFAVITGADVTCAGLKPIPHAIGSSHQGGRTCPCATATAVSGSPSCFASSRRHGRH